MKQLDIIYVLSPSFEPYHEQLETLLPQALIYHVGSEGLELEQVINDVKIRIKTDQVVVNRLNNHYLVDLSQNLPLVDIKKFCKIRKYLPVFDKGRNYAHLYVEEANVTCSEHLKQLNSFKSDELDAFADFYLLTSDIASDDTYKKREILIGNTANTILSLSALGLDKHGRETPFMTTSTKFFKWSEEDSRIYSKRKLVTVFCEELNQRCEQGKANQVRELNQVWQDILDSLDKQVKNYLDPIFQMINQDVYNSSFPLRTYEKGASISLLEAEKEVFGSNLSIDYQRHYENSLKKETVESFANDFSSFFRKLMNRLTRDAYRYEWGGVLGLDYFLSDFIQLVDEQIIIDEKNLESEKKRIEQAWTEKFLLVDDKGPFWKKRLSVEEKLSSVLVETIFKKYDNCLLLIYRGLMLSAFQSYLKEFVNRGQNLLNGFDEILQDIPKQIFPELLGDEVGKLLDKQVGVAELMLELNDEVGHYYLQEGTIEKPIVQFNQFIEELLDKLSFPHLENLLLQDDSPSGFQFKFLTYLSHRDGCFIRTTKNYFPANRLVFFYQNSCLKHQPNIQGFSHILTQTPEQVMLLSVFKDISLTDLLAYRYEGGEL